MIYVMLEINRKDQVSYRSLELNITRFITNPSIKGRYAPKGILV